jgi:hypothetical protein
VYDLAHHWGVLPQALVELPCTQVDDLLAFADYEASRSRRWQKDSEWRSKRDQKRTEVAQDGKRRAQFGPRHVE